MLPIFKPRKNVFFYLFVCLFFQSIHNWMYFQLNSQIHDYNTRSADNLHLAIFRANFSQFSIRFQGRSYPYIFHRPAKQCNIFSLEVPCYFNCLSMYSDGLYFFIFIFIFYSSCTFFLMFVFSLPYHYLLHVFFFILLIYCAFLCANWF